MFRTVTTASFMVALLVIPTSVTADEGHRLPRITKMRWQNPPVTTSTGECDDMGKCDEEILIIKAHDPNSSITEIQVWFDEGGNDAPFVMAHTYCVQGTEPGKPARLKIGGVYKKPGQYTVAAVAYSHRGCLLHEKGDGHDALHSKIKRKDVTVKSD